MRGDNLDSITFYNSIGRHLGLWMGFVKLVTLVHKHIHATKSKAGTGTFDGACKTCKICKHIHATKSKTSKTSLQNRP